MGLSYTENVDLRLRRLHFPHFPAYRERNTLKIRTTVSIFPLPYYVQHLSRGKLGLSVGFTVEIHTSGSIEIGFAFLVLPTPASRVRIY